MDFLDRKNGNFNMFTFVLLGNCAELNDNLAHEVRSYELRATSYE